MRAARRIYKGLVKAGDVNSSRGFRHWARKYYGRECVGKLAVITAKKAE